MFETMKDALMEYETIDSDQIDDIMSGTKPRPPKVGETVLVLLRCQQMSLEKESRDMASDDDEGWRTPVLRPDVFNRHRFPGLFF